MVQHLRSYLSTRGGVRFPLLEIAERVRAGLVPDGPDGVRALAEATGLPAAAVRAALDYYSALRRPAGAPEVCRGTSCFLSRGGAPPAGAGDASAHPVHCLGYCDRAPAVRTADGRILAPADGPASAAAPPAGEIRNFAARPIVTARLLDGDFADLGRARAAGVYGALDQALRLPPAAILDEVERSGHRGRGGAAFPTGRKWRACAATPGDVRYVVANGDEGDPGSFVDRLLLERDPHAVLEGLSIAAYAVGAHEAFVFIRAEYPDALARMTAAIADARGAGILGPDAMGSGFALEVSVFPGAGSYVCGEETALLNAMEGFRGEVRVRPPYPVESGLFGRPTVVQNVETLAGVPFILREGAAAFAALGIRESPGTKAVCLNRGFTRPGLVEVEFGTPLRRIVEEIGGGARDGGELAGILLGGPMGSFVTPDEFDVPLCWSAMAEQGITLGHGGIVAVPREADLRSLAVHLLEFAARESCGKCVPCRHGSARALDLVRSGAGREDVAGVFDLMEAASLCAFGRETPGPVRRILDLLRETER